MASIPRIPALLLALSFGPLGLPAAAAGTLDVGPPGSGATFTEIQDAVDAAFPGDVILVAPSSYQPFQVTKSLRILGAGSDLVTVGQPWFCNPLVIPGPCAPAPSDSTGLVVRDLGPGDEVLVSGMTVHGRNSSTTAAGVPSALLADNAGSVILHDLVVPGGPHTRQALVVESCERVIVYASSFTGRKLDFYSVGVLTDDAVHVDDSTVWWIGSELVGPSGMPAVSTAQAWIGGKGLVLVDSAVSLARTEVLGGAGGSDYYLPFPGADAIDATNSLVGVVGGPGNRILGGAGGIGSIGPFIGQLPDGAGIRLKSSSAALASSAATISGEPPLAADSTSTFLQPSVIYPTLGADASAASPGDAIALDLDGNPGATGLLFVSLNHGPSTVFPGVNGVFVLDPVLTFFAGAVTLAPDGTASSGLTVLNQPALVGQVLLFQWVEVAGAQLAGSNPVLVPIVP